MADKASSVANTMAAERQDIISKVHAPMSMTRIADLFDKNLTIQGDNKATMEWNARLAAAITDAEGELTPWLTPLFNRIMDGEEMPRSFTEGLIIPLRKNGDSDYTLDYRAITLLPSCCKVLAKVIANRLQNGPQHLLGETQQGFVKKRLLERSVVLMQSVLREAYAAEILALVIQSDGQLHGIPVPGANGTEGKALLGLRIQPKKSVMISLNTTVIRKEYLGILVLAPWEATRYLGVQVGHTNMTAENWDRRDDVHKQCWAYLQTRGGHNGSCVTPTHVHPGDWEAVAADAQRELLATAIIARDPDGFTILATSTPPQHAQIKWTDDVRNFWPTAHWAGNPWI
ncbi:hypothetical protein PybrP1_003373, partial [[Pythium] brassicae (nom. inval.)]